MPHTWISCRLKLHPSATACRLFVCRVGIHDGVCVCERGRRWLCGLTRAPPTPSIEIRSDHPAVLRCNYRRYMYRACIARSPDQSRISRNPPINHNRLPCEQFYGQSEGEGARRTDRITSVSTIYDPRIFVWTGVGVGVIPGGQYGARLDRDGSMCLVGGGWGKDNSIMRFAV